MDEHLVQQALQAAQVPIINIHLFYPDISKPREPNPDRKRICQFLGHNTGPLRKEEIARETPETQRKASTLSSSVSVHDTESGMKQHFQGYLETADDILNKNVARYVGETMRHLLMGAPQKALDYLSRAINLRPHNANLFELRAEICFRMQDFTSAIKNYKKALQLDQEAKMASVQPQPDGTFVTHSEKSVISEEHLMNTRASTIDAAVPEQMGSEPALNLNKQRLSLFYFMYGQSLYDLKRYVEALEAYSGAVALEPDCIYYHISCLSCLVALRRTNEALSVANRLIEDGYRTADMFLLRARLLRLFKNYNASFHDVQAALRLQPDHPIAVGLSEQQRNEARQNVLLADELTIKQRYKEALQHISLAIEMDPSAIEYHLKRGIIYRHLQDHNAAIDSFMTAMSRTDSAAAELSSVQVPVAVPSQSAPKSITHISIPSGHHSGTHTAATPLAGDERALVPLNNSSTAMTRIFEGTPHEFDNEKAEKEKQVALLAQRQLVLTYSDFAVACLQKGYCNDGILLLNKAIKVEKSEKGLYVNRGDCFFKLQEYDFALADYEQALELDPNDIEIKQRIAVVYSDRAKQLVAQGKHTEAIAMLGMGLEYMPLDSSMYAMRANSHYTKQSLVSAQQDTVLALLIDPHNDKMINFAIKLFNKQSVTEVLQSRVGEQMKLRYMELVSASQQRVPVQRNQDRRDQGEDKGRYSDNLLAVATAYQQLPIHSGELREDSSKLVGRLTSDIASTVQLEVEEATPTGKETRDVPEPSDRSRDSAAQAASASENETPQVPTSSQEKTKKKRKSRKANSVESDVLLVLRKKNIADRVKQQYQDRGTLWQNAPRIIPAETAGQSLMPNSQQATGWRKFSRSIKA